MDWTLEVVVVPISNLDAALEFYREAVGFRVDHEVRTEHLAFAQRTPCGSGCSIVIGNLPHPMEPGSLHGVQPVVSDAAAARGELVARAVDCGEISVMDERDGGTLFGFRDPDGNS